MRPFTVPFAALLCVACVALAFAEEVPITPRSTLAFATIEEGRAVIGRADEYVQRMSAFDRRLRMDREEAASEPEFLAFAAAQVTAWPTGEQRRISAVLTMLAGRLAGLDLPLPARLLLIRTTGREEEGVAHTRGHAVVLPARSLSASQDELLSLFAHELFHLMTRHDAEFRKRAYALIGFRPTREIVLPTALQARRITNPDAPRLDTYIEASVRGRRVPFTPILLANAEFSLERGVALHDYWQLRFLALSPGNPDGMRLHMLDGEPVLYALRELEDFFQQVGRNTPYLIHPEEILADNFALLATGQAAAEPDRLLQLKRLLQAR